jgi:hypothetical protein
MNKSGQLKHTTVFEKKSPIINNFRPQKVEIEGLPVRIFENRVDRLLNIKRVMMDERTAAAANAAMTIPTTAPVLRLDLERRGNTGKKAWKKCELSLQ